MNNESKYYTPEITEFYVGFECEIQRAGTWDKFILTHGEVSMLYTRSFAHKDNLSNLIRVKYLDLQDIQELGFVFVGQDEVGLFEFRGDEIELYFNPHNQRIIIFKMPELDCIFRGQIKNKSELKKVLEMINYE